MSNVQLPEPEYMGCDSVGDIFAYSESQLKQYGDDRAREALENAAQLFEPAITPAHGFYAKTIRALAKEIK